MGPGGHPLGRLAGRQARADGEAAAQRLGERHDVGRNAGTLVGEQLAGAPHAGLHLVEDQQQAMLVAQLAQRLEERRLDDAHAALAHDRLDQNRRGLGADRAFGRVEIAERHLIEAVDHRAEPFEIFLLSAGGERRQRAAVEGALESDDAVTFRLTVRRLVFARHLDRAFHRLGAGIAEEHHVGEAGFAQTPRDALGFRNFVKIGDVPHLLRLLGERGDELRMCMPQRIHGNAGGKIEIALAVRGDKPRALAPLEGKVDARIGRQQMRCHG